MVEDLDTLPPADIVILGEVHDSPIHHLNQARAVKALAPKAVVFEMLWPEQAAQVTPANRTDETRLEAALGWNGVGWPEFSMYWPIFEATGDAPILGAALPRDVVRGAVGAGAAAQFPGDPVAFGLTQPLPAAQQSEREDMQMEAHCNAMPEAMMGGMVEAQRLRDANFAKIVVQALETYGAPVVLITGNGHARNDWGVPAAIALVAPEASVYSLAQFEEVPDTAPPFDGYLVTAVTERDDPCAAFRG